MTTFFQYTGTPVPWSWTTRDLPSKARNWLVYVALAALVVAVVWGVAERIRARRNPPPESRSSKRRRENRNTTKTNSADSANSA